MEIYKLYSRRLADAAKAGEPDVYQYDEIPHNLRVQVELICTNEFMYDNKNTIWRLIEYAFLLGKGRRSIAKDRFAGDRILTYMYKCTTEDWIDLLELIAYYSLRFTRVPSNTREETQKTIDNINHWLREAGVGYQLENARIIRIDSQFLHAEVVKPALTLLSEPGFDGPRKEFLEAHQYYRHGDHRQAVTMAACAVESTFKAIFDQKGWAYPKGARISDLVKVARANRLWPDYLDKSFDQLTAMLTSGLPEIRNNHASHGDGAAPKIVPSYVASHALHLAASNILFIAEAAKYAPS